MLTYVRGHVEERLRTHLRKRHKVRDRKAGYVMFRNRALYEGTGSIECRHQQVGQKRIPEVNNEEGRVKPVLYSTQKIYGTIW
jgi:hypothetical protein